MTYSQFFLQRAERSKQRRQTFHGFTVKDENNDCSDVQNRSRLLLSQEVFSPDDRKSGSLSAHKKGLGKSVTFKDTVDTNQLPPSNKGCHGNEGHSGFKEKLRRSSLTESCILETEPEADVNILQDDIENASNKFVAADKNQVITSSDSILFNDEKICAVDMVNEEHKDCSRTQDDQDWLLNKAEIQGCSDLSRDIPVLSTCSKEHSYSDDAVSFASSKTELVGKEMEISDIDTVVEDKQSSKHNSEKASSKEGLDESTVKVKDIPENEEWSAVHKSDNSPLENWKWLQLFEEEFPRRSPRLRSTPNFGSQTAHSQDNSHVLHPQKTKSVRSKQFRVKKESTLHSGDKIIKCKMVEPILHDNLNEERITKDFVFPRPSSEKIKNGVIVDFSLPDKEFAKLKLEKIKGALPVERINRDVANDKSKKKATEHDGMMNSSDDNLIESKSKEDMTEACCFPSSTSASSVLACSAQVGTDSPKKGEENRANEEQVPSAFVNLDYNKHSECTVNNSPFNFEHQQFDLQLQKEPVKCCKDSFSPKQQSEEDMTSEKTSLCQADIESSNQNNSYAETFRPIEVDDIQQSEDSEKKLRPGNCEQHALCDEHNKLDNKSSSDIEERLLDNNVFLQCCTTGPQKVNEFLNEKECYLYCPEAVTVDTHKTCSTMLPFEANKLDIQRSPEQQFNHKEFNLTEGKPSPSYPEPSIGDQATPHGKMREPLESSQLSCMTSLEHQSERSPLLMMACLQVNCFLLIKFTFGLKSEFTGQFLCSGFFIT